MLLSMIVSAAELEALVAVRHSAPHELLGMHKLGDRKGLVVRAYLPHAARVEAVPVHESGKPTIHLHRIHDSGLFEGTTDRAHDVFAYDLVTSWPDGTQSRSRDPYSFLPSVGESDLYLFGQGNERRIYDKLGAHLRPNNRVVGASPASRPRGGRGSRRSCWR